MEAITNFLYWLDDLLWGNAMTVIVVGTGILLSLRFAFALGLSGSLTTGRKISVLVRSNTYRCSPL